MNLCIAATIQTPNLNYQKVLFGTKFGNKKLKKLDFAKYFQHGTRFQDDWLRYSIHQTSKKEFEAVIHQPISISRSFQNRLLFLNETNHVSINQKFLSFFRPSGIFFVLSFNGFHLFLEI